MNLSTLTNLSFYKIIIQVHISLNRRVEFFSFILGVLFWNSSNRHCLKSCLWHWYWKEMQQFTFIYSFVLSVSTSWSSSSSLSSSSYHPPVRSAGKPKWSLTGRYRGYWYSMHRGLRPQRFLSRISPSWHMIVTMLLVFVNTCAYNFICHLSHGQFVCVFNVVHTLIVVSFC